MTTLHRSTALAALPPAAPPPPLSLRIRAAYALDPATSRIVALQLHNELRQVPTPGDWCDVAALALLWAQLAELLDHCAARLGGVRERERVLAFRADADVALGRALGLRRQAERMRAAMRRPHATNCSEVA